MRNTGRVFLLLAMAAVPACADPGDDAAERAAFQQADDRPWREVFADEGTGDWEQKWFLDGEVGKVTNGPEGMTLTAGPEFRNDAHHMVLWTRDSFEGDLKIEYDYTRLDEERRCVTILYIQATGSGRGSFARDIASWSEQRRVPSMRIYYDHMNTYHVSYAAFGNSGTDETSYIRGRRYMPHRTGLKGTELEPDYRFESLFDPGVTHRITVIKRERDLLLRIENPDKVRHCHLRNDKLPVVTGGRIGLRHMFTRSARYRNFRVSTPAETAP
ncbi:YesU family protein [Verrucomicrobiaceae bacterium E54]|nr:YesU family protein [Verrucomicrobiaceae bacterium E54]